VGGPVRAKGAPSVGSVDFSSALGSDAGADGEAGTRSPRGRLDRSRSAFHAGDFLSAYNFSVPAVLLRSPPFSSVLLPLSAASRLNEVGDDVPSPPRRSSSPQNQRQRGETTANVINVFVLLLMCI